MSRRRWEAWDTGKFVPAWFLAFWPRATNLKKKSFFIVDGTICSLHSIVTGDKSWFYHFNPWIKRQSLKQLHKTSPKRKKNIIETIFWSGKGYFSRFCHKEKQSMPLLTIRHSRSFVVHWVSKKKQVVLQHANAQLHRACKVFGRTPGNLCPVHPTLRI
jgi:hypothetical protein